MVKKYAAIMRPRPYCLDQSADALLEWVHGRQPLKPLANLSFLGVPGVVDATNKIIRAPRPIFLETATMDFEPACSAVKVGVVGPKKGRSTSAFAMFTYSMANDIVRTHSVSWSVALKIAKSCWTRMLPKYRVYAAGIEVPKAHDGEIELTLEDTAEADEDAIGSIGVLPLEDRDR